MKLILSLPDAIGRPFIEDDSVLFSVEFGLKHACDFDSRVLPEGDWKIEHWNEKKKLLTLKKGKT